MPTLRNSVASKIQLPDYVTAFGDTDKVTLFFFVESSNYGTRRFAEVRGETGNA
jgi:uncharacterized protein with NRDE domain